MSTWVRPLPLLRHTHRTMLSALCRRWRRGCDAVRARLMLVKRRTAHAGGKLPCSRCKHSTVRQASATRAGTHKKTGKRFAIKSMSVAPVGAVVRSNDSTWADVAAEVSVLCRVEHENVIGLEEFFFTADEVYLITPLVQGALSCKHTSRLPAVAEPPTPVS